MTEQELHLESERLIEEARLEIEAIKEALEASRRHLADCVVTEEPELRSGDAEKAVSELAARGYRVEAALNSLVAQRGLRRHDQVLPGLWHRTKEEKLSNPVVGFVTKLGMLASACWSYTRFALARRSMRVGSAARGVASQPTAA